MNKYLNPKNYWRYFIDKIFLAISPIIRLWEEKHIEYYSNMPLKHQPIFIIGAPRTGSTILYQVITNQLDVLYIDNLTCKFFRNLFFGFWLSNKIFKQKAHNCFKSKFGDTSECGLHAPSECGEFWYRWLPKDRHFIDYSDITDKMVEDIRSEITAIINYFDKPLVFKNLNAGQRMRLIKKCFPEAKFIFVKRDIIYTAQSIINGRRKLKIRDNEWWGIMPNNVKELNKLNIYEKVIKQIIYLENQILIDKDLFDEKNFSTINYKEIGKNINKVHAEIKDFIGAKEKNNYISPKIELSNKIKLSEEEISILKKEISKLDWETYND